jgi:hypothetical protein
LRKRGKSTVGYNVQAAVDAKHHLITTSSPPHHGRAIFYL